MVRSYKLGWCALAVGAVLGSFSGCSTPASGGGVASADCQGLMAALCGYLERCDPSTQRTEFGSQATCTSRYQLACGSLNLPGATWSSAQIAACAQAVSSAACGSNVLDTDACLAPQGTLSTGSPCERSDQCASSSCSRDVTVSDGSVTEPLCGTCMEVDGGSSGTCGGGSTCPASQRCVYDSTTASSSCVTPGPAGSPCAESGACLGTLFCKGASSTAAGVCTAAVGSGGSCTYSSDCDSALGLRCVQNVCALPSFVQAGASCETEGTLCEYGSNCHGATGARVCVPNAADGAACDSSLGPGCFEPASCRQGVCRLSGTLGCN